jgi:hypothetical protein
MRRIGSKVLPVILLALALTVVHQDGMNGELADVAPRKPTKASKRPTGLEKTESLGAGEHFGTLEYSVTTFVDGKEVSSEKVPVAQAVPGKPGFIFSPYDNKVIDATSAEPGSIFKDPGSPPDEPRFIKLPGGE